MNLSIFLAFLVTLKLNNATLFTDNHRCTLRTFYRGAADKRLELNITQKDKEVKNIFTLTIFLTGNHNTQRNHYTIKNQHVLNSIRADHAMLKEENLNKVINYVIEFGNMWRGIIEFDSDEFTSNTEPNQAFLYKFQEVFDKLI
jgi:hypothetical protein